MSNEKLILFRGNDEIELPTRFDVCPRCEGRGTHVNPNIDGNGITADEMAELGDDFREDYMAGVYDVPCERCGGKRVVSVPDESRISAADLEAYQQQEYEAACERDSEARLRRMESGERW